MQNPIQPADVRALLDVVLEAIDLPYPATVGDGAVHDRLLVERAALALSVARGALAGQSDRIAWNVDYLRSQLPTAAYRTLADEQAGR